MNKENNLAGHTLVVDRVKELKGKKSDYIRQVTKTAQANKKIDEKETQEFYIKATPSLIERDDVRRDSQTIVLQAIVNGYKDPVPNFEINGLPRMCGYHTGDTKATLITTLESYITNQTPYTPNFSGTNNWSRGGALFTVGDTVSVCYLCSDNSYVTAIMTVTVVNTSSITGTVNSIVYTLEGFDDRDTTNTQLYIPYAQAVPLNVVLYNGADQMDSIELSVTNNTRHRRTFGVDSSVKGDTYTEGATEYNYIEGDSFVQVSVSGDTKTAVIKAYIQDSWIELNNFPTYSRYDEILTDSLPDVFSVYQAENHVVAAGYDWFKQIIAEHISAVYYFVGGAIYGYGQNGSVDMTQSLGNRVSGDAFIIDANGIIEFSSGFARNLNVRGILNLYADNGTDAGAEILHPALTTVPESEATDTVGVTVNTQAVAWSGDNLLSAVSGVTKNAIDSASGSFGNKSLAYYVYADNLATQLRAQVTVTDTQIYIAHTFSIPRYVKGNLSVLITGFTSSASTSSTSGFNYGTVTIKRNGTTVYSYTGSGRDRAFSYTISLTGNDTVTIVDSGSHGSHNISYAKASYVIRQLTLADYVSSVGFWFEYSNGSMEQPIGSNTYTDRLQMSSPVSFDSNNYLTHRDCSALIGYTSYTEGGTTYNLDINVPYTFLGTNLTINGASVSSGYFSRISSSSVRIQYGVNAITVSSGNYYNIYGNIAVQKTERGVETMGLYPRSSGYNLGRSDKYWLNAYITNPLSVSKRSEKHDIQPYERNALAILNNTEIVRFKLNIDPENTPHIGFIADDTDSDLSGEKHDSFISNHVIAVCVKAIQELSAEVEQLKAERKHNL